MRATPEVYIVESARANKHRPEYVYDSVRDSSRHKYYIDYCDCIAVSDCDGGIYK